MLEDLGTIVPGMLARPRVFSMLLAQIDSFPLAIMTFEEATKEAARIAGDAVNGVMTKYRYHYVTDEEDITGRLAGALDQALEGEIGGLEWHCTQLRHHSGKAAEEKKFGADLLICVKFETNLESYAKGVLVQAKRVEPDEMIAPSDLDDLKVQCNKMLDITAAAFVFNYSRAGMRCGPATRISGTARRDLHRACGWTAYRFFLELFRCPVGDPKIRSALVDELPTRHGIEIQASGSLDSEKERGPMRLQIR